MIKGLLQGIFLIILGCMLYFVSQHSNLNNFFSGVFIGLSIGVNMVGAIVVIYYIEKQQSK